MSFIEPVLVGWCCACWLVLPIDIDDFFVDLNYILKKSAKRKEKFREFKLGIKAC